MDFKVCGDRLRDSFYSCRPGAFFFRVNDILSNGSPPFTHLNREKIISAASTFCVPDNSRMKKKKRQTDFFDR